MKSRRDRCPTKCAAGGHAGAERRVVVTGMGVVSCLGHDPDTFYNNLLEASLPPTIHSKDLDGNQYHSAARCCYLSADAFCDYRERVALHTLRISSVRTLLHASLGRSRAFNATGMSARKTSGEWTIA